MDRLPAVSDTKASSKCIGTRLAKFRFRGEWNGYWLYQIQKYQVNVSGTNEYRYPHVSDTAKTCINPSLVGRYQLLVNVTFGVLRNFATFPGKCSPSQKSQQRKMVL
ncbi:hypothetical protein AVEN_71596-1 [Araneus ventricosus]|uniref:Uncharacterized protein n=1 Tax=Araneus ventricosus TaxID=182803 RepID=A0A4Y2M7W8_ARAVE|nr:hypothetical protein AVEN_71596-1 [Araneus ventricosus]